MQILISGAGLAGLALALNLGSRDHEVTVVERASHFRVNGSPIDIRGDAISITGDMGLLTQVLEHRVRMTDQIVWVNSDGEEVAGSPEPEFTDSGDDIEIPREDLAHILADALPPSVSIRFLDSIDALADDGDGVDVRFASGRGERFDLVLGADGLHSVVRRLVFGPERDYLRHLGLYVALTDLPGEAWLGQHSPMYNFPGHLAGIGRFNNKSVGVFMFRSGLIDYDYDYHDPGAGQKILADAFAGHTAWRIPELLDAALADSELYFDSVSQIHMPSWHKGRIALVGDAAHCASLLSGRGTSLAFTGAYFLAEELTRSGGDHAAAFQRYHDRQRSYVTFGQNSAGFGADLLVPTTWEAITARNKSLQGMIQHKEERPLS
jgi:2-polyprenyl-6-methoxyphenol hydroxylase-like FAD-dependent oxidoreductase